MRSVQMGRFGGPHVLEVVESPTPVPGPGQVLVRVGAVGVNFADTLMRENRYVVTPELPAVLGNEGAGTVEALGPGVDGPAPGTRVAVPLFAAGRHTGGYADHVLLDASLAVPLPDGISLETATALMVQGLTALFLTKHAPPNGKTVLVNAAAGGVGSLLVQLAKAAGAKRVIAAASSAEKLAFARNLGADAGVDYTSPDWVRRVRDASGGQGADLIYESAGGPVTRGSLDALAPLGQMVIYGALNVQDFRLGVEELINLIFKNQTVTGFALVPLLTPESLGSGLRELFAAALSGALRVTIGGTYPLEDAAEAHRRLERRQTSGKLVLLAA